MTIKLTTLEPRVAPSVVEPKTTSPAGTGPGASNAVSSDPAPRLTDARPVELTEASRQLAEWIQGDQCSAGVDEAKVARLRVEIEHGTYRLDSTRIAEGLLTSEKELLRLMDRG